jgi:hypothetical protein
MLRVKIGFKHSSTCKSPIGFARKERKMVLTLSWHSLEAPAEFEINIFTLNFLEENMVCISKQSSRKY